MSTNLVIDFQQSLALWWCHHLSEKNLQVNWRGQCPALLWLLYIRHPHSGTTIPWTTSIASVAWPPTLYWGLSLYGSTIVLPEPHRSRHLVQCQFRLVNPQTTITKTPANEGYAPIITKTLPSPIPYLFPCNILISSRPRFLIIWIDPIRGCRL